MSFSQYKSDLLIHGNPNSQVGILTLWTKKENVSQYLDINDFAYIGQLYNPSKGIAILIRNCLANKNIRHLIICGQDLSKSGEALLKLKEEGVEEVFADDQLKDGESRDAKLRDDQSRDAKLKDDQSRDGESRDDKLKDDKLKDDQLKDDQSRDGESRDGESRDGKLKGYLINGLTEKRMIEKEIPLEAINLFRNNVDVIDCRHLSDLSQLKDIIKNLSILPSYGEPELYPEAEVKVSSFPTDNSVFKIKSRHVGNAWLKILDTIMRFGVVKESQYSEKQKEILNLTVIITEEDPNKIRWRDFFQFSKEHLEAYFPMVLSAKNVDGVNYTYGTRLRSWRGIDQIESLVKRLKSSINTRRAVAVTWDVEKDHQDEDAPCLDLLQCLVQNNLLFMTAFIRSNDMFEAWPENVLALRKLQSLIAEELKLDMGSLTTISGSSHIYERNWQKAEDILAHNPVVVERLNDPRGNCVIYLKDNQIILEHQASDGSVLEILKGQTAEEISVELVQKQKVSDLYHALYLGRELGKAELALKKGLNYIQEKDLEEKNG
ncbi:MAG: thymidylate synthase [Candidatus Woesearchaeota archaeon]